MPQPTVSIIIPTFNEEKALPATLNSIVDQAHAAHEIIIIDGGSQDNTHAIVQQWMQKLPNITFFLSPQKGRSEQMNLGASKATGDWLLFSHADTLLPKNAIVNIQSQSASTMAGCFKQQFSESNIFLSFISCLHNFRCELTHIMYGDQSIFIRRKTFVDIKGYQTGHMEDIKLSENILSLTKPALLNDYVVTDSRKFKQRGVLRSLLDVVIIITCYQCNKPIPNISQSFFSDIR